jgi:hypothetical protein
MEIIANEGLLVAELITTNFQKKNPLTSTKYNDK